MDGFVERLAGAAVVTATLALLEPGGMIGGVITLIVIVFSIDIKVLLWHNNTFRRCICRK